jgi:hypothetical protein
LSIFRFLFLLLLSINLFASDKHFTLERDYFISLPTNRASVNFVQTVDSMEYMVYDGFNRAFDDSSAFRISAMLGTLILWEYTPWTYLSKSASFSMHEYGHRQRGAVVGYDIGFNPSYGDNLFSIWINSSSNGIKAGDFTWDGGKRRALFDSRHFDKNTVMPKYFGFSDEWSFNIFSAGLNQQMQLSENVADRLYENDSAHIVSFFLYADSKLSTLNYPLVPNGFGDKQLIASYWYNYAKIGSSSDKNIDDLEISSVVSYLLSSTTWAYFNAFYNYATDNTTKASNAVKPIYFYNFRAPDVSAYYNWSGLSYKIISAYKNGSLTIPFHYEFIQKGVKQSEISLGANYIFDNFGLKTLATYNLKKTAKELKASLSYELLNYLSTTLGYKRYDINTLDGWRNIPSIKGNKDVFDEYYLTLDIKF